MIFNSLGLYNISIYVYIYTYNIHKNNQVYHFIIMLIILCVKGRI